MAEIIENEEFHDCDDGEQVSSAIDGSEAETFRMENDVLENQTKNNEYHIDEEYLAEIFQLLTEEEKLARKETAIALKADGNCKFVEKSYEEAAKIYTEALRTCFSKCFNDLGAILYSNRAACFSKMDLYDEAIADCSKSIELDNTFTKAYLRRAQLYEEKEEHFDKALEDFQAVLKQEPNNKLARESVNRLPYLIAERNEKMKNEMIGKLKDLGNLFLRPFGLSTDNFKMEENPSGGFSLKMQK